MLDTDGQEKKESCVASERFTNALNYKEQSIPPIWMMRQAGRYHAHYQKLRAKYSFMELCKIPEVAAEVALGPVQDFDFDLAILFSDLLFPLEGLGMGLKYTDQGPRLDWHLDATNFDKLRSIEDAMELLEFQRECVKQTRALIPQNKSLIGFVGGLWTLFTYAVIGKHDGSLTQAKILTETRKKFFPLLQEIIIRNIQLQLDAGAEVVMIFDTAAGELSSAMFDEIVFPYVEEISKRFPKKIGYYSKNTTDTAVRKILTLPNLAGVGFDHRLPLVKLIPENTFGFTQGNFDQSLLFLETSEFKKVLKSYITDIKRLSPKERIGWVSGLGHGVLPKTPEANVKLFVETIREEFA